jgi:hypothetical protein
MQSKIDTAGHKLLIPNLHCCPDPPLSTELTTASEFLYCIQIPSSILLAMLGKSRVTKFILQEILSVTVGDFVKKVGAI